MNNTTPVFVTGASGNVGLEVVKGLRQLGHLVRAGGTNPQTLHERFGPEVDTASLDFSQPETFPRAFQGVKSLFLMRPPHISNVKRYLFPAIDAAKQAGVQHIVFLSLIGIEHNTRVPHYAVEQYVMASGIAYTFLRASFFMQNLNTTHRAEIRERNEIFVPVGHGKTSFIDVRDIAAVAALALTQPGHENQAYDLTGGEALDYYQVAEVFSEVLRRRITYRNPSAAQFLWRQIWAGTTVPFALIMTWLYWSTRNGMAAQVTGEVQRLLGREPISLRRYVEDYREAWAVPARSMV